ncbi:ATP-dependent DNA helicase PIF1-like [Aphis craccivora]|uniref:ATP-dependent DNA helicase PIF1-like n=1 Tax=Aphis craccivora TaxID=307492 RepID=A0A6G0ZBE2_APHCR|nr:ATP-dependent DNA helicase PIF1-like [Aphis craccivora]
MVVECELVVAGQLFLEPRLQVKALHKNVIEALVITGCARRNIVIIPRITLIQTDYPFEFKITRFPLNVCFAMTINKSKGQSLIMAGIVLREECFSHGQFYFACFRVSSASSAEAFKRNPIAAYEHPSNKYLRCYDMLKSPCYHYIV